MSFTFKSLCESTEFFIVSQLIIIVQKGFVSLQQTIFDSHPHHIVYLPMKMFQALVYGWFHMLCVGLIQECMFLSCHICISE